MSSETIGAIDILRVIAITGFAGGTSFLGIWISKRMKLSADQNLGLTAFGAGILMSAAIFSMVVEAEKSIGIAATLFAFLGGAIAFTLADIVAEKKGGAGILLGMGLDSVPESLAIGAAIASGPYFALSLLIGIQNISEGIASYKEMMTGKTAFSDNPKKVLASAAIISVLPVILGLVGLFYLTGMKEVIASILALSAGGIFYMLYYDMIPKAHKDKKWLPTFGAVVGFILGFGIVKTIGGQ
jgi:zinc transporter, ZIP family